MGLFSTTTTTIRPPPSNFWWWWWWKTGSSTSPLPRREARPSSRHFPSPPAGRLRAPLSSRPSRSVREHHRHADPREPRPRKGWPSVQVEEGTPLHRELSALCPAEASRAGPAPAAAAAPGGGEVRPLAVRPVAGRAIFFWHEAVEGSDPLLDVFHGGSLPGACPVRRGEKLSLQKFKNFAAGTIGCEASRWCRNYF
ncbi:unnamed protein product [Prorocentrum cordatum]|uniref:Uncharacterized protein n=1 Tax=Prorocentrum cordatum TaxID=2364126 RepID=A0ABN9TT34_9DINO|nr:unnamed protein product [Polarella glacialis]